MSVSDHETSFDATRTNIDRSAGGSLSKDTLFHLLQNQRRRRVVEYISGRENPIDMREIAEQVAAWEHDTTVQQLTSDERQRVYIALYQSHLPKLDKAGIIEYNQSRGIVERTDHADQIERYLDPRPDAADDEPGRTDHDERDWSRYYAGVTILSAGLVGLAWPGIVGILSLPVAALLMTGVFAVTTLFHHVDDRET